jgi:GNAT superfamily N-acetyltransferase
MARLEILPFADEHLEAAAGLLAERHRRQRLAEPLLPERYESPTETRPLLEDMLTHERASGAVATEAGRVTGYVLGTPKDDKLWGANMWVELAGHAVEEAEVARDLYAAAAARWVDEGRTRHYVLVPATDAPLVNAWFSVGFGLQHVHAIRELPDEPEVIDPTIQVGDAEERDIDALVELAPLLNEHQNLSPVFGTIPPEDPAEIRAELLEELGKPEFGNLVAEVDDRVVGNFLVCPLEMSSAHTTLGRPDGVAFLGFAVTHPDVRGSGAGLALTSASFRWARTRGYDLMVTDWRATNLLSSRFWPARGFRPTFYRLYRSIP